MGASASFESGARARAGSDQDLGGGAALLLHVLDLSANADLAEGGSVTRFGEAAAHHAGEVREVLCQRLVEEFAGRFLYGVCAAADRA